MSLSAAGGGHNSLGAGAESGAVSQIRPTHTHTGSRLEPIPLGPKWPPTLGEPTQASSWPRMLTCKCVCVCVCVCATTRKTNSSCAIWAPSRQCAPCSPSIWVNITLARVIWTPSGPAASCCGGRRTARLPELANPKEEAQPVWPQPGLLDCSHQKEAGRLLMRRARAKDDHQR